MIGFHDEIEFITYALYQIIESDILWYHNVMNSSGFAPHRERSPDYPSHFESIAQAARPFYEPLFECRMQLDQ